MVVDKRQILNKIFCNFFTLRSAYSFFRVNVFFPYSKPEHILLRIRFPVSGKIYECYPIDAKAGKYKINTEDEINKRKPTVSRDTTSYDTHLVFPEADQKAPIFRLMPQVI